LAHTSSQVSPVTVETVVEETVLRRTTRFWRVFFSSVVVCM
jgi:hypothetical protein